jgi:protein SCO1/2
MRTKRAILAIALALLAGCTTNAADKGTNSCCAVMRSPAVFTDKSLYQVESKWTNDAGKQITLGNLGGKPQVVAMFFANCQYACPLIVSDMKRIEAALPEHLRTNVRFTLVSFDTQRDTVEALADYRRARGLPLERWTLLRGGADDVLELAALLGVSYKQDVTGQFSHSNIITVLNTKGEIVRQQVGLNQDVQETVRAIEKSMEK